jgi:hypothetical protein
MEVDIDELVRTAAAISIDWGENLLDKTCLILAFDELYPEVKLVSRYHKQLREYRKLTRG